MNIKDCIEYGESGVDASYLLDVIEQVVQERHGQMRWIDMTQAERDAARTHFLLAIGISILADLLMTMDRQGEGADK